MIDRQVIFSEAINKSFFLNLNRYNDYISTSKQCRIYEWFNKVNDTMLISVHTIKQTKDNSFRVMSRNQFVFNVLFKFWSGL